MKKLIYFIMVTLFTLQLFGQEEETIFSGNFESDGFGGPVVSISKIAGSTSLLVGGRGGWIINHTFAIGVGGYGLSSHIPVPQNPVGRDFRMDLNYGGLELEYIINSKNPLHFTTKVLIGGGSVSWKDNYNNFMENNNRIYQYGNDIFFVVEPCVNIEINLTKWFRINLGANYRVFTGVDSQLLYDNQVLTTLKKSDLSGVSGVLTFKFGSF